MKDFDDNEIPDYRIGNVCGTCFYNDGRKNDLVPVSRYCRKHKVTVYIYGICQDFKFFTEDIEEI